MCLSLSERLGMDRKSPLSAQPGED
uniref:Uncharacterized protein n=1 Tax=Anguilla anguilla TaxID=7936 RepID=A0A0E9P854_ANGAN